MAVVLKKDKNSNKFEFSNIINFFKKPKPLLGFYLILLGIGFLYLCTAILFNDFTTPFGGDYCSQQFAFYTNGYDDWWHFFRTGEFVLYDTNTFLGANNIGSNSFYYLFDPFFMPILLFPREFVPQGMAVLTIFKMATGGLAFYAFMRVIGTSKASSKIAATAYAFSGWTAWYLWFNHFTEIIICLPLIFIGVEKVIKEKNPLILSASILLSGLTNFFFMFALLVCGVIYALFRYFQRIKTCKTKENLLILAIGIAGFAIGLLMSAVVVLPSTMVALESDRAVDSSYLDILLTSISNGNIGKVFNMMFSWANIDGNKEYRSLYPIIEFFYPVTSDRGTPLTKLGNETYDNVAGGLFCFTPMIILLTPALVRSFKEKKYSHFIAFGLFLISLFSPFVYYLFFGFTQAYSRWYLFVVASLIAYVGKYLDKFKEDSINLITIGGVIAILGEIIAATLATIIVNNYEKMTARVNIPLVLFLMVAYTSIVVIVLRIVHSKKYAHTIINATIALEAVLMGAFTVFGHGLTEYKYANNGLTNNNALYDVVSLVNKQDKSYFRSYSGIEGDSAKNDGMRNNYNSASFFHSIYNFNTRNFIEWSKIVNSRNGWSGSYVEKRQDLDTFLGMKYYYILKENLDYERLGVSYTPNTPLGVYDISSEFINDRFLVHKSFDHINFAFSYDSIINYNDEENPQGFLSSNSTFLEAVNEEMYLTDAILDYKDVEEVINLYPNLTKKTLYGRPYSDSISTLNVTYNTSNQPYNINVYKNNLNGINNRNISYSQILDTIKGSKAPLPLNGERDDKLLLCIEPGPSNEFPYDPNGVIFYMDINYVINYKHDVYFIGENDELITMDRHSDNYVTDGNNRRDVRGFYLKPIRNSDGTYSPAPRLKKIVLAPRYGGIYLSGEKPYYPISYQLSSVRDNLYMDEIRDNPIENVTYKTNEFSFTTDFEKNRFICTQIAFDKGWKVIATSSNGETKEVKTYLTQGGFVGFVSLNGFTKYTMKYETPYLRLGNTLSIIGGMLYFVSAVSYIYISFNNDKKTLLFDLKR